MLVFSIPFLNGCLNFCLATVEMRFLCVVSAAHFFILLKIAVSKIELQKIYIMEEFL